MSSLRIFVKRGAIWRFNRLTRDAEKLPVTVEWDRRQGDRRAADREGGAESDQAADGQDKRKEDRRGEAPFTWNTAEFVVVEERDSTAD